MAIVPNPKLIGSGMIDCVPQVGPCPQGCDQCFYNKWFYAGHDPVMPSLEEAEGKIVRVNSGHDSNIHRGYVIEATRPYEHKFYNTSIPDLRFKGLPVLLTVNGAYTDRAFHAVPTAYTNPLMGVRFRANVWNFPMALDVVDYYAKKLAVPVIMTFMRYYDEEKIRMQNHYEYRRHVNHDYWDIKAASWRDFMESCAGNDFGITVFSCGTPEEPLCKDCGACEKLYWRFMEKYKPQRR